MTQLRGMGSSVCTHRRPISLRHTTTHAPRMLAKLPSGALEDYIYNETRHGTVRQSHPEEAREDVAARWKMYETWASMGANGKG